MNSDNIILINLVLDYLREDISPDRQQQLNNILTASPDKKQLFNQLTDPDYLQQELILMQQADVSAAWQKFKTGIPELEQKPKPVLVKKMEGEKINWWKWVAAAVIVGIAVGSWWWFNLPSITPSATTSVVPAGNSATLTINDNKYDLTEGITDTLDNIPGMQVIKQDTSLWYQVYDASLINKTTTAAVINTVKTNRGSKYLLRLADGTKVWLYPGTTISYAAAFAATERSVQVTGEAYFEVAKEARPFRVYLQDSTGAARARIDVTGTRFNVNAYAGAPIKTTLLEGRLQLNQGIHRVTLTGGQQAIMNDAAGIRVDPTQQLIADTSSWRQGKFVFQDDEVSFVINELARWYNLKTIVVSENVKGPITMNFDRTTPFTEVLTILKKHANIRSTIKGDTIIVVPDE